VGPKAAMFSPKDIRARLYNGACGLLRVTGQRLTEQLKIVQIQENVRKLTTEISKVSLIVAQLKKHWWLLPLPVVTTFLGIWQVRRLEWKTNLIRKIKERTLEPPIPLPQTLTPEEIDALEYRKVQVTGKFLHDKEFHVMLRAYKFKPGLYVITPFQRSDGGPSILVNRGWVPTKMKDPLTRSQGQITDEVTLTGYLRKGERPSGILVPVNDPVRNFWYYIDVPHMATLAGTAPILIDAESPPNPGGYPIGGVTKVSLPNEHLQYAVTWFALSIILTGMLIYNIRKGVKSSVTSNQYRKPI
jgi:surfeit locus 1 family protein